MFLLTHVLSKDKSGKASWVSRGQGMGSLKFIYWNGYVQCLRIWLDLNTGPWKRWLRQQKTRRGNNNLNDWSPCKKWKLSHRHAEGHMRTQREIATYKHRARSQEKLALLTPPTKTSVLPNWGNSFCCWKSVELYGGNLSSWRQEQSQAAADRRERLLTECHRDTVAMPGLSLDHLRTSVEDGLKPQRFMSCVFLTHIMFIW